MNSRCVVGPFAAFDTYDTDDWYDKTGEWDARFLFDSKDAASYFADGARQARAEIYDMLFVDEK